MLCSCRPYRRIASERNTGQKCLALLDLSRRNWFRISRLVTIIAIGLRTPMLSQNQVQVMYFMMFIDLLECW